SWTYPASVSSALMSRIQRIVQSIAHQVQRENNQRDRTAGKHGEPPGTTQERLGLLQHLSPADTIGVPEPEEAQPRLEEDRARHLKRGIDHDRAQRIGKDLPNDQTEVRDPERLSSLNELPCPQREDLSSYQASRRGPTQDGNDGDDGPDRRAEERDRHDG